MTLLEELLKKTDDEIVDYLTSVSITDFKSHIEELKIAYTDQNLLESIIQHLSTFRKT
jgi:hypothetical protein